ncbi:hypothetical protein GF338_05945, partial [candidate division WOR-3 bacterium]|nr:hypothetical protein [candidate division WOR-3 bacterium]
MIPRLLNPEPALRPSAYEVISVITKKLETKPKITLFSPGFYPRLVFTGREKETEEIERRLFTEHQIVVLKGEVGSGKTRLIRELKFRALVNKKNVVLLEGRGSHLSILDHLSALIGLTPSRMIDGNRLQRFERIIQKLYKKGLEALLVDCPSNLTEMEKEALGFLARGLKGKAGVLLTENDIQLDTGVCDILLAPLDEDGIEKLVSRSFPSLSNKKELVSNILVLSNGNPGRINKILDILYRESCFRFDDFWRFNPPSDRTGINHKISRWLDDKLKELSEDEKRVMNVLCLSRQPLPLGIIKDVLKTDDIPWTIRGLREKKQVTQVSHDETIGFEISGELFRKAVYDRLPAKEKGTLLKKIALATERMCAAKWGKDPLNWERDYYLAFLAEIAFRAGLESKACLYLPPAAQRMIRKGYNSRAKAMLEHLLSLNTEGEVRKKALIELARIASLEGDPEKAQRLYTEALGLIEQMEEKARVLYRIGFTYQKYRFLEKAQDFIKKGLDCLGDDKSDIYYRLLSAKAWNALYRNDLDEAEKLLSRCVKEKSSAEFYPRYLYGLSVVLSAKGTLTEALNYGILALEESEKIEDETLTSQCILLVVETLQRSGRSGKALEYLSQAERLSVRLQNPTFSTNILLKKAAMYAYQGKHRQARETARQGLEISNRTRIKIHKLSLMCIEAEQTRILGEWDTAQRIYRDLWGYAVRSESTRHILPHILINWTDYYLKKGKLKSAGRMLRKAQGLAKTRGGEEDIIWTALLSSRLALALEDIPQTKSSLDEARSLIDDKGSELDRINLSLLDIQVMIRKGSCTEAVRKAQGLLSGLKDNGFKALMGEALHLLGKAL